MKATTSSRPSAGKIVRQKPPKPITKNNMDNPNNSTIFVSEASHYSSIMQDLKHFNEHVKQQHVQQFAGKIRQTQVAARPGGAPSGRKNAYPQSISSVSPGQQQAELPVPNSRVTPEKELKRAAIGSAVDPMSKASHYGLPSPGHRSPAASSPRYHMTTPKSKRLSKSPVLSTYKKRKTYI